MRRRAFLAGVGATALVASCSSPAADPAATGSATPSEGPSTVPLASTPPGAVTATLTAAQVGVALDALDGLVAAAMARTGVPGVAVAVVHEDQVRLVKGYGVREVGRPGDVGADTVFQLASVSKPLSATVVAGVVGRGTVAFTDPVRPSNPAFALSVPYVTENASFADLLSHQSGLRTGAGDLLEDLGFDQATIVSRLAQQPLTPFRASYNYSNFGYTLGATSAAEAAGRSWVELADETLLRPLGMTSTSFTHADFTARPDRAALHVPVGDRTWEARFDRQPDAEAPAGGASSSATDLAQWLRLVLAGGEHDGTALVDADALAETMTPHVANNPATSAASRSRFYGLGWNVSYDDRGRAVVGHSGAFNLGAATCVTLMPGEGLGIVVLTNGRPQGTPEAIATEFLDVAANGAPTVDWLGFFGTAFQDVDAGDAPAVDYSAPTATPTPPPPGTRTGTWENSYYGPLTTSGPDDALVMTLGPADAPVTFPLTHYSGPTWTFETVGENANGLSGATFTAAAAGRPATLVLDFYDRTGLGTFTLR